MLLGGEVRHVLKRVGFGVQFAALSEGDAGMLGLLVEFYRDETQIISGILCDEGETRKDIQRIKGGRVLVGPIQSKTPAV